MLVSALHDSTDLLRAAQPEPGRGDGAAGRRPDEVGQAVDGSQRGRRRRAELRRRQPGGARHDVRQARRRSRRRWSTASTTSSRRCTSPRRTFRTSSTSTSRPTAAFTGALAVNNFANPISFLCGAIQAASRLGAEQSAKLCVQYLAPIVKNRQYNFPPLGTEPVRRRAGPAQRGHLQRGLDAAGLRSARRQRRRQGHRWPPKRRPAGTAAPPEAPHAASRRRSDRSRRRPARHDGAPREVAHDRVGRAPHGGRA